MLAVVGSTVAGAAPAWAAPSGTADRYTAVEDSVLEVGAEQGVLANDAEGTTGLSVALMSEPIAIAPSVGDPGLVELAEDGSFVYTPGQDFSGAVAFTYAVADADGVGESVVVIIDVTAVNDVPIGTADAYTGTEGTALEVDRTGSVAGEGLRWNDNDADGDDLSTRRVSEPTNGELTMGDDGSFTYTPRAGFSGADEFFYELFDGQSTSEPVAVTITVRPLPTTTITSGPANTVNSRTAQFTVESNSTSATIECSLDGAEFAACEIPVSFDSLADGAHTFTSRSLTQDGLLDTTPATWSWRVDTTVPVLTLTSPTNDSVFTLGQVVTPAATCIDTGVVLVPTLGPVATDTVGSSFTYSTTCTDPAGNVATATATYSVVPLTPPPPPVVEPPVVEPLFDVRWRAFGARSARASLNGAQVSGQIKLMLTDAAGTPVGRDRSVHSMTFRIVDGAGHVVLDGTDRRRSFALRRGHHHEVAVDTTRWADGAYTLETVVATRDGVTTPITSSFEVSNTPRRRHHGWGRDCS